MSEAGRSALVVDVLSLEFRKAHVEENTNLIQRVEEWPDRQTDLLGVAMTLGHLSTLTTLTRHQQDEGPGKPDPSSPRS